MAMAARKFGSSQTVMTFVPKQTFVTVSVATWLVAAPQGLLTTTKYSPAAVGCTLVRVRLELLAPTGELLKRQAYESGDVPAALTLNVALWPTPAAVFCGCEMIAGNWINAAVTDLSEFIVTPSGLV